MILDSVKVHEKFDNVIVVKDQNLFQMSYLMTEGVLVPGRIWLSLAPTGERVSFFLPIPEGTPVVLMVEAL